MNFNWEYSCRPASKNCPRRETYKAKIRGVGELYVSIGWWGTIIRFYPSEGLGLMGLSHTYKDLKGRSHKKGKLAAERMLTYRLRKLRSEIKRRENLVKGALSTLDRSLK